MAQYFKPPAALSGDAAKDAAMLYGYLFRFSEQLNAALTEADARASGVIKTAAGGAPAGGPSTGSGPSAGVDPSVASSYNNLRSLIVKTATTVRAEMDEAVEQMRASFVAESEFGAFLSNLDTTIRTNAEGILLDMDYESRLTALDAASAGFSTYQTETEQFIKIGVVRYNDDGTSEAGVVIGKNLSVVTVDGKELVTSSNMYSCFTADRLSFWKDGVEVAYFSNRALYVTDVHVLGTLDIGGDWLATTTNGFSIKWIGG
jgi:hypothetical protein